MDDNQQLDLDAEWLEADGLGGFASGTVGGPRTRRYHALLLTATTPPTGRVVLVNGIEAWVESGCFDSSSPVIKRILLGSTPSSNRSDVMSGLHSAI